MIIKNKKAFYDYNILDTLECGIVLLGSEVKSIKGGDASIKEAYCLIIDGEMWIKAMHIAPFKQSGTHMNHEPLRDRKLLLNKKEIKKLESKVQVKGYTIVPLNMRVNSRGLIKVDIGLGTGKKTFDKKQTIKERDLDRDSKREMNKY